MTRVHTLVAVDWNVYDAALFDLDGVITPTADVHMHAWDRMFNDFLTSRAIDEPYTDEDYYAYVDGKPRYDGVRSFLASRGIIVAEGTPDDDPAEETVCGLGNRKNAMFNSVLSEQGIAPYPGSLELMNRLRALAMPMAIVSSSRNAGDVLNVAGIRDYFGALVDGRAADAGELAGKPAPDTFVQAARELGATPEGCVVFEDAISGVEAGRAGGFACVIGVDRGAGAIALSNAGAHQVVTDLSELL